MLHLQGVSCIFLEVRLLQVKQIRFSVLMNLTLRYAPGEYLNDLYALDPMNLAWIKCNQLNEIAQRTFAGAASAFGKLYIFGGASSKTLLNDLQMWDPATEKWTNLTYSRVLSYSTTENGSNFTDSWDSYTYEMPPSPREGHGLVAIESMQKLYIFGGVIDSLDSNSSSLSSEFYEFDLRTSAWTNCSQLSKSVSPRAYFGFAATSDKLYLFGGLFYEASGCDLYHYYPSARLWSCAVEKGPYPNKKYIMLKMVSIGSRLYVFGGFTAPGEKKLLEFVTNLLGIIHS